MAEDEGTVPLSMIMQLASKGVSLIPGVSEQGEEGVKEMLMGAFKLVDDVAEDSFFDKAVDVDS